MIFQICMTFSVKVFIAGGRNLQIAINRILFTVLRGVFAFL